MGRSLWCLVWPGRSLGRSWGKAGGPCGGGCGVQGPSRCSRASSVGLPSSFLTDFRVVGSLPGCPGGQNSGKTNVILMIVGFRFWSFRVPRKCPRGPPGRPREAPVVSGDARVALGRSSGCPGVHPGGPWEGFGSLSVVPGGARAVPWTFLGEGREALCGRLRGTGALPLLSGVFWSGSRAPFRRIFG